VRKAMWTFSDVPSHFCRGTFDGALPAEHCNIELLHGRMAYSVTSESIQAGYSGDAARQTFGLRCECGLVNYWLLSGLQATSERAVWKSFNRFFGSPDNRKENVRWLSATYGAYC
jgi:hypothetical protein